jgi:hypothetical protein
VRPRRAAVFGAVLAVWIISSSTAGAYTTLGATWALWPVPYYINPTNMDVPESAIAPAVRAAADAWPSQSGTVFSFAFAGFSAQATNANDGINLVMFRNAASGSALATTYSWFSGTRMVDADIVFWDGGFHFFTGSSGCSGGFYIEDVATHEFGHALGLGHSTIASATMYPTIGACSQATRTLDQDDVAAVLSLYPSAVVPPVAPRNFRILR